jgi:phosphoribosyl 1,2-cyclic phosphodiesterase
VLVIPLQSGSAGNCVYVEAGGARLLFDAGISAARAQERLRVHGRDLAEIDAVIISHDHSDHVGAVGVLARRGLPVHLTAATRGAALTALGEATPWREFRSGEAIRVGGATIETISTPHDAADGSVFVVDDGAHRLGILTDFGHVFAWLPAIVETLDAVYLESNYDDALLRDGPYPPTLKRRIAGPGGHISNLESADLIANHGRKLRWACLAHLSESNNHPTIALATHRRRYGDALPLSVASRGEASAPMTL